MNKNFAQTVNLPWGNGTLEVNVPASWKLVYPERAGEEDSVSMDDRKAIYNVLISLKNNQYSYNKPTNWTVFFLVIWFFDQIASSFSLFSNFFLFFKSFFQKIAAQKRREKRDSQKLRKEGK